jgi:hypothetical protein
MPILKGISDEVAVAVGDKSPFAPVTQIVSGFGVSGVVLEQRGILSLTTDPSPAVQSGEIFEHDAGDRFTLMALVPTDEGLILTETEIVDVGGTFFAEKSEDEAVLTTEEVAEELPPEDVSGSAFVTGESGASENTVDVSQGTVAEDGIPIGTVISDVLWDEASQSYINQLYEWNGEAFVPLS